MSRVRSIRGRRMERRGSMRHHELVPEKPTSLCLWVPVEEAQYYEERMASKGLGSPEYDGPRYLEEEIAAGRQEASRADRVDDSAEGVW